MYDSGPLNELTLARSHIFSADAENYPKYSQETVCIFIWIEDDDGVTSTLCLAFPFLAIPCNAVLYFIEVLKALELFALASNTEIFVRYYHHIF